MVTFENSYHLHVTESLRLNQSVPGIYYFAVCLGLERVALSQYKGFNFNSLCKFGDGFLGANEHGIFSLEDGDSDQNGHIEGHVTFGKTDFGVSNEKRFRKTYVGYETSGELEYSLTPDDGTETVYTLSVIHSSQRQHSGVINGQRSVVGRYYTIKVSNLYGCDFSLDSIDGILIVKGKNPSEV